MYDISVIIPTARYDYPIIGQPHLHMLEITLNSLIKQTFKEFEVIIIDALYSKRNFPFDKLPITCKHIPIHSNHRFWIDRKRWNVCGTLNTGIMHSEGELIVRIDDCSEFDVNYLKRIWDEYETGLWLQGMHIKFLEGRLAKDDNDNVIMDSRLPFVKNNGGRMIGPHQWMYGYSSFTNEAALKINGFDELFDGDKQQEDQDFGSRLVMAGYENKFLLDSNHTVIEHEHGPIPNEIIDSALPNIKCNYAIYRLNRIKNSYRANETILTQEDINFIKKETLKPPCSPRPKMYADNCEGDLFKLWIKNQNIFSLREERMNV